MTSSYYEKVKQLYIFQLLSWELYTWEEEEEKATRFALVANELLTNCYTWCQFHVETEQKSKFSPYGPPNWPLATQ